MLAPHIIERENGKAPGLLAFALASSRVAGTNSTADNDRSAIAQPIDKCHCLSKAAGAWLVTYAERGEGYDIERFAQYGCNKVPLPLSRARQIALRSSRGRESRSGQQFSMLESAAAPTEKSWLNTTTTSSSLVPVPAATSPRSARRSSG
jgi:hypothetical protein